MHIKSFLILATLNQNSSIWKSYTLFKERLRTYQNFPKKRDEETPILCHNDPHLGNMMIDENDKTGDSLVLIDFDNTKYGYRVFDFVYHFNYHSISKETNEWEPNGVTEFRGRVVLLH